MVIIGSGGSTDRSITLREWVRPDGDPDRTARNALTNMVMEKAADYPELKPEFMQSNYVC